MSGTLLVVCASNVCRSPLAAATIRTLAGDAFEVVSAGTVAIGGAGACDTVRRVVTDPAVAALLAVHRAQRLDADLIARADLILTAESAHRSVVARLDPHARMRTFTMLEAVALAGVSGASGGLVSVAAAMNGARGRVQLDRVDRKDKKRGILGADMIDGHLQNTRTHAATVTLVSETAAALAGILA